MGFTINEAVFQAAAASAANTAQGQAIINQILTQYIETGVRPAGVTGNIITKAQMQEAVEALKDMIVSGGSSLPASVQANVRSLKAGEIEGSPGNYTATLTFEGDLSRPSLDPDEYGGLDDIIALFNSGYNHNPIGRVFGEWHGERVGNRTVRIGTHFVNAAIDAFNSTYGAKYFATAKPGENFK